MRGNFHCRDVNIGQGPTVFAVSASWCLFSFLVVACISLDRLNTISPLYPK